jgi:lipoic acid synthetase
VSGSRSPEKPRWIRTKWQTTPEAKRVRGLLREHGLHTVCEESSCPNRGECYNRGVCTFLILGAICTRHCRFCDVTSGHPLPPDPGEPKAVAESVHTLGVKFVVITSVDRDDLPDLGSGYFAETVRWIKRRNPGVGVEVLTPDFQARPDPIRTVLDSQPEIFAHNVETVRRLTPVARDKRASWEQSLQTLRIAAETGNGTVIKSGLMVGLGETDDEVLEALREIRTVGVVSMTIGQYLPPSRAHLPVKRYVTPETFEMYANEARAMGYTHVASAPLVRSSYRAEELVRKGSLDLPE